MLILNRKPGERLVIGRNIVVTMIEARAGRVRLGFEAPEGTPIHREEVFDKICGAKAAVPMLAS